MKYTGITLQIRLYLICIIFVSSEEMVIKNHTHYLDLMMKAKLGMSILGLYAGIYHLLVAKDMFASESSKTLYMQISSAFLGLHASYYILVLI